MMDASSLPVLSPRSSDILTTLAHREEERIAVNDILGALNDKAFAILVVILGLPNCLPMPPPIPMVCGFLIGLVAVQMAAGRSMPWLPKSLQRVSIQRADFQKAALRAIPALQMLERWSRPRFLLLHSPYALQGIGFCLFVLALGLLVAAPVIGQIPLGFAICLVGLGLVERDGLLIIGGFLLGLCGLALNLGFVYAMISAFQSIL
jgi:hypothetical protein